MLNEIGKIIFSEIINRSTNITVTKLNKIKSEKARNILRGINPSSHISIEKALEKINANCSAYDYKNAVLIIKTDPLFFDNDFGQLFNQSCPRPFKTPAHFTIKEILNQIELNKSQLKEIISLATKIIEGLYKNDFITALNYCNQLKNQNGCSIFLLRVIAYVVNRYQLLNMENSEVLQLVDNLKSDIKMHKSQLIGEVVTQLSNLRTSHMAICKRINDLKPNLQNSYVAKFFISPIPSGREVYIETANAFFAFSLFDAFLYISTIENLNFEYIDKTSMDIDLINSFSKFSDANFKPEVMYEKIDEDTSYYYLRECFLFIEQKRALKFLSIHGYYYSYFSNQIVLPIHHRMIINNYFKNITNLSDLRTGPFNDFNIAWDYYDNRKCGMLENSSALVHLITKKEGYLNELEQSEFVRLMSFTRDIGAICHPEYLENISYNAKDELVKLVAQCLITIHKKNQYAEHDLRSTIQEYSIKSFDGDLIKLFEYLHDKSPAVMEHFIIICNETFLSTLFHLMDNPVDALKLRADMLEWFGKLKNDERYIERAKTLRVDIQINKEKGTIDDSRVYVDPLKYTQWFEDLIVSSFTMDLDNLIISNTKNIKFDTSGKGVNINPGDDVVEHIFKCYREFCENKIFGIASYLGRRIRHGTFKGTAVSGLKELAKADEYQILFEDKEFKVKYEQWLFDYENMVEELVNNSLQIKSKRKPNGLITTELDTPYKHKMSRELVMEILSVYSKKIGVVQLPGIIIDYCWRMVEVDLAKVRRLLSEMKSSYGVFSFSPKCTDPSMKKLYYKFTQEINSTTGHKFRLMASWFNKPSYASPSTDIYLLFSAVVSEVKDRVTNFNPKIDVGDKSFPVNGGAYYVIYDALYVLIHNAAIHGKQSGKILFLVTHEENKNAIKIELRTEINTKIEMLHAQRKIESALANSDDDAYVIENNSGIKKIKKLEREESIDEVGFFVLEHELLLCFEFTFKLGKRGKYHDFDC